MTQHGLDTFVGRLASFQAAYFLLTGIWPQVHLRSFEWISGPKVDDWLVKSVGLQVGVVGSVLGLAASQKRVTPEIELLAAGSALGLAAIDVVYASRRRIRRIYLLDAAIELAFVAGWTLARSNRRAIEEQSQRASYAG